MRKPIDKTELFEKTPIRKAIVIMCIPTIISSLVMMLYSLVDTYFVGLLADPIETSAVSLAAPVLLAFNAVNNLFGVGTSSIMSRSLGAGDTDTVKKSSAFGFYCSVISGLLFCFLCSVFHGGLLSLLGAEETTRKATSDYLVWTACLGALPAILNVVMSYMVRAEGSTLHASIGSMSGCVLNMVLDPVFILPWGLNMGAAGAGCATFISNCAACLYFFWFLYKKRGQTYVCIDPREFRPSRRIAGEICSVGIPASIQNLLNVTGMTILNNFGAVYGPAAVSAIGIAHKISMVPFFFSMGVSNGIMPLISYNYASGDTPRMKKAIYTTGAVELTLMVIATAVICLFAGGITKAFMDESEVIRIGTVMLQGMTLAMPFLGMDFLGVGVFNACGMGGRALLFAILRKIVLEIPLLFLLNALYPLFGLGFAQLGAEMILCVISVTMVIRLIGKLEKKSLTPDTCK